MKVIKDNGTYRVVYTEQLIKDDNGYVLLNVIKFKFMTIDFFLKIGLI